MEKEKKHGDLRRLFAAVICFAAVVVCGTAFFCLQAQAAESTVSDETLTLAVELSYDGEVIEGVEVCVFYIGSVSGDDIVLEGDFAKYAVTTEGAGSDETSWNSLALTLAGYSFLDALEPTEKDFTDASGEAFFPLSGEVLQEGVYLVLTQTFQQNDVTYTTQPFLVILPDVDYNAVVYHVVAVPKITSRIGAQRITVLKIWDDSDSALRPDSIEVTLVSGTGEVWETVTLSEENSWRYTFTGLPEDTSWYVVEDVPDGYTVLETADGNTIALTNTLAEEEQDTSPTEEDTTTEPEEGTTAALGEDTTTAEGDTTSSEAETTTVDDGTDATDGQDETTTKKSSSASKEDETTTVLTKLPQTGTLWWVVPILACCGMVSVLIGVAKKRGQEEEE